MFKRTIFTTEDGSVSLKLEDRNECFHSMHGAIQESKHIFVDAGLESIASKKSEINILEIGYGTGLNALLSAKVSKTRQKKIIYTAIEAFPINATEHSLLNYDKILDETELFDLLFSANWNEMVKISDTFYLQKVHKTLQAYLVDSDFYDLIYFDAFSPETQAELWTEDIFTKLFHGLKNGGILVTYSCKGIVKRALKNCGFTLEKLPGPPGKREFLRATKP